jgi:hypothetical protein
VTRASTAVAEDVLRSLGRGESQAATLRSNGSHLNLRHAANHHRAPHSIPTQLHELISSRSIAIVSPCALSVGARDSASFELFSGISGDKNGGGLRTLKRMERGGRCEEQ